MLRDVPRTWGESWGIFSARPFPFSKIILPNTPSSCICLTTPLVCERLPQKTTRHTQRFDLSFGSWTHVLSLQHHRCLFLEKVVQNALWRIELPSQALNLAWAVGIALPSALLVAILNQAPFGTSTCEWGAPPISHTYSWVPRSPRAPFSALPKASFEPTCHGRGARDSTADTLRWQGWWCPWSFFLGGGGAPERTSWGMSYSALT